MRRLPGDAASDKLQDVVSPHAVDILEAWFWCKRFGVFPGWMGGEEGCGARTADSGRT